MKSSRAFLAAAFLAAGIAIAAAASEGTVYRFGDHPKHVIITFVSEADIENIYGMSHEVRGQTWLDFEGMKGKCNLRVPVKSLDTGIALRNEHLQSDAWLDEAKYPEISFVSDGFDLVAKNAAKGLYEAKVAGKLTIHGVTRDLDAMAKIVKFTPEMSKRIGEGDWVHVTCAFPVTLKDFEITIPDGKVAGKVNPTWDVKFDCYATSAKEPTEK